MAKVHGQSGAIYISTSGSTAAVQQCSLSSWSLDMTSDTAEVTSFCDANKTYVKGKKDLKGSFSGFYDNADDSIFIAADSATGVKIYLYPDVNTPAKFWSGPAWLNTSLTVGVGGPNTVSGNFMANGSWTRV